MPEVTARWPTSCGYRLMRSVLHHAVGYRTSRKCDSTFPAKEPPRRCERIVPAVPYAERDGLRLYYERDGRGGVELLFVPGWCCDHTFFAPQFDYFRPTHTVTTLALRGCGRSDSPSDGYDIPSLADDITWFCAEVGIERPVVVGTASAG